MKAILDQLARSGLLWNDEMVAEILAGTALPLEDVITDLCISCMDAEVTVRNDLTATWNHRRLARLGLALAFIAAISCMKEEAS